MKKIRLFNYSRWWITAKKRSLLHWMVFLVAFWSFFFTPINRLPNPLGYFKYLPDGILLIIMVLSFGRRRFSVRRPVLPPLCLAVGFFFYALIVYLLQYQSVAYFLWGFRNNFRFLIAFFAFIGYMEDSDTDTWFKALDILFWVNAVLAIVQFLFLGISGDYLGGIFGYKGKTNAYTLAFFIIVIGKTLLSAFNGTEDLALSIFKCAVSIIIAAAAEMKFYFFVIILLLLGAALITRFSTRKLVIISLCLFAIMLGSTLLVSLFDFQGFLSLEGLWKSATKQNYASQNDINRLSAIPSLSRIVLTNPLNQIFGLGLGNCDTSAFAICNTPFYRRYGYLHYTWFTSAMLFLEVGFIGLAIYICFFIICFLHAYKQYKKNIGNLLHNQLAILISLICVVLMMYNSSLRIEAGYMIYFVLALPFIRNSTAKNE